VTSTHARATLALGALLLTPLACSRDDSPTSPQSSLSAEFSSPEYDTDHDGRVSDAEKAAAKKRADQEKKHAEKERQAKKEAERRAFEALKDKWRIYKDSVKEGLVDAEIARCEPLPSVSEKKRIGPDGGELRVGPHRLLIPAGALNREVEITGTSQAGAQREVDFQPHGLQFREPVRLRLSFEKCVLRADDDVQVVYTGPGNQIVARQPSFADGLIKSVDAWTDHFSGYAVAVGRE
jgi:hypothetical protein